MLNEHLSRVRRRHSVLNVKVVVASFNNEKALPSRGLFRDCEFFAKQRFVASSTVFVWYGDGMGQLLLIFPWWLGLESGH